MITTRNDTLSPAQLFQAIHDQYSVYLRSQQETESAEWKAIYEKKVKPIRENSEILNQEIEKLSSEDILAFCKMQSPDDGVTGLWLALWGNVYLNSGFPHRLPRLIDKIIELSDDDFNTLDVSTSKQINVGILNLSIRQSLDKKSHRALFAKIMSMSDDKLQSLFGHSSANPSELTCIIKLIDLPTSDDLDYLNAFVRFFSFAPSCENFHPFSRTLASLWLKTMNDLKHYASKLANPPSKEEFNKKFESIVHAMLDEIKKLWTFCGSNSGIPISIILSNGTKPDTNDFIGLIYFYCITLARCIDTITPPDTSALPIRNTLLEAISLGNLHPDPAFRAIYHESQDLLANYYFTEPQTTVENKHLTLKKALRHAVITWLCDEKKDTRLILRIAEAFLYATNINLNNNGRGINVDLPELGWLKEELEKMPPQPPTFYNHEELNKAFDRITTILHTQRNLVAPICTQLALLTKKNAEQEARLQRLERLLLISRENSDSSATPPEQKGSSPTLFAAK